VRGWKEWLDDQAAFMPGIRTYFSVIADWVGIASPQMFQPYSSDMN